MNRGISLLVVLALGGCSQEGGFREKIPQPELGNIGSVDSQTQTDIITQTVNPSVDILYMVDNSCSMSNDQQDLSNNFPVFMQHFLNSGLDYHIGVVSSDIVENSENGRLQGGLGELYITADQNNQINRFTAMAVLGAGGHFPEKGIAGVYRSYELHGDGFNSGFFRDDSALHVIAVSDEFDYTEPGIITIDEFINWFDGLKRSADNRSFSAIEDPNAFDYASYAKPYRRVTASIGGVYWNIQDENWSPALDQLGLRATGLKTEYFLSKLPLETSIEVVVKTPIEGAPGKYSELPQTEAQLIDGEWQEGDWYYTEGRNSINFLSDVPSELSQIWITYTVRSSVVTDVL